MQIEQNSVLSTQRHLLHRFVDATDARFSRTSTKVVDFRCDGTAQGKNPHTERHYSQAIRSFVAGVNMCPECGSACAPTSLGTVRPDVVKRLFYPEEARLGSDAATKVRLWCDGSVQGRAPHPKRTYTQAVKDLTNGGNGCPECRDRAENTIEARFPQLLPRLVSTDAAAMPVKSRSAVTVWCDGLVAGQSPHERVEYTMRADRFVEGRNACPTCGRTGSARSFAVRRPELVHRFADPADAAASTRGSQRVRLWCDGEAAGHEPHAWTEYEQIAANFDRGMNGCPLCKRKRRPVAATLQAKAPAETLARLVYPGDAETAADSSNAVTLFCDGGVQGRAAHTRIDYEAPAREVAAGTDECPACRASISGGDAGPKNASEADSGRATLKGAISLALQDESDAEAYDETTTADAIADKPEPATTEDHSDDSTEDSAATPEDPMRAKIRALFNPF